MPKRDKIKGVLLVILGIVLILFVYNFDTLMGKPPELGTTTILCIGIGIISIINGIRIYRRK